MDLNSSTFVASIELMIVLFCLFSIVYLGSFKNGKNKWLIVAYSAIGWTFLNLTIGMNRYGLVPYSPFLQNPAPTLVFFPSIYLYTINLIKPKFLVGWKPYLLFLPFLCFYMVFIFTGFEQPSKILYSETKPLHIIIFLLFNIVHTSVYLYLVVKLVNYNHKMYQNQFADNSHFITLDWIKWMVYIMLIFIVINMSLGILLPTFSEITSRIPIVSSFLLSIVILSYFSFKQPILYQEENSLKNEKAPIIEVLITKEKPTVSIQQSPKSTLSDAEKAVLVLKTETYMEQEKPFLNTKIRMPELAKSLDIPRHVFSQLINEHYQINFFHFTNKYRVKHAKELLIDENYQNYTLESIGELSGFNSRSTFNRIFKTTTGKSPKEYQKEFIKSQ